MQNSNNRIFANCLRLLQFIRIFRSFINSPEHFVNCTCLNFNHFNKFDKPFFSKEFTNELSEKISEK